MADLNVLIPTSSVNGTVTTCGIDTQLISTSINSAWSMRGTQTFRSYNKCTGAEIQTFTVPSFTGLGIGVLWVLGLAIVISVIAVWAKNS